MFGFTKKFVSERKIFAPFNGEVIELEKVPDVVFSQKMLGDGFALIPSNNVLCSPINGVVAEITDTLHAFCIESDDSLDILIHVGLDTIELKGEGFKSLVNVGDRVRVGTPLAQIDLGIIKEMGYNIYTAVLISNINVIAEINVKTGECKGGETIALTYKKK